MTFGATPDIVLEFNTYEAIFWLLLGVILYFSIRFVSSYYRKWLLFSSLNVFLFGISDIVEIYTGGFLHTAVWLLYWKAVHVFGLVLSAIWYFLIRIKQ